MVVVVVVVVVVEVEVVVVSVGVVVESWLGPRKQANVWPTYSVDNVNIKYVMRIMLLF